MYDIILPLAGGLMLSVLLLALKKPVPIFGKDAYLGQLQTLLTILAGFFVAALTMITADRSAMLSDPVGGRSPPRLPKEKKPLSRRRFLAYLFGYLSAASITLVGMTLVANLVAPQLAFQISPHAKALLKWIFVLFFNLWLCHIAVATLLGLFYFTERLQIPDSTMRVGKPDGPPRAGD